MIEEFLAIPAYVKNEIGKRLIDGIIVLGEEKKIQVSGKYDFKDKDIIIIQTKSNRLGMYLMGQEFFSREIMKRFKLRSIRTFTICGKPDIEMEQLCKKLDIEVAVIPETLKNEF